MLHEYGTSSPPCALWQAIYPLPAGDPSRKRLGAFLVQTQLQGSANSSCMYLTGAAQNLLCMKLAMELGCAVHDTWLTWFKVWGRGTGGVHWTSVVGLSLAPATSLSKRECLRKELRARTDTAWVLWTGRGRQQHL